MRSIIKNLLIISIGAISPFLSEAGVPSSLQTKAVQRAYESVKRMETQSQDLMADAIDSKVQIKLQFDNLLLEQELENEEEMYPADDLYGHWYSERVNPYGSTVIIPDSFAIDVSTYVPPTEGYVTSPYGPRRRRFHYGIDLKVQVGDTIRAAFDGKVRVQEYQKRGYGYHLVIRHNNGLETTYAHLSNFLVESDQTVKAGQPIALGGNTGRSTGSHLHFETRLLGMAINPALIIDFKNYVPINDVYVFTKNNISNNKYQNGSITYHRVKKGDSLGKIARRYGISINVLCRLNNIKSNKSLRAGTTLRCS